MVSRSILTFSSSCFVIHWLLSFTSSTLWFTILAV